MAVVEDSKNKAEMIRKLELGLIPDDEIKRLLGIQMENRLRWGYKPTHEQQLAQLLHFAHSLRKMKIADEIESLESQLYEMPVSFMKIMNGSKLKISSSYFKDDSMTLDEAEVAMLDLYCERAQIKDGQTILDLGCGMGAFTLHVAEKYKSCRVTSITNSVSQKEYIEDQCRSNNLLNVEVILADITKYEMYDTYDCIMAIGLLEHMKNYKLLLSKISKWMSQDGFLFIDHMCHKTLAYQYEPLNEDDWFADYIFPPGTFTIPSATLLLYFQDDVSVVNHWTLSGKHFERTHEEWLKRIDANIDTVKVILEEALGNKEAAMKFINYFRNLCLFGITMFGYNNGEEWMVSHLLLKK